MAKGSLYLKYKFTTNAALFWYKVPIISFRIYKKFQQVNKFSKAFQNKISRKIFTVGVKLFRSVRQTDTRRRGGGQIWRSYGCCSQTALRKFLNALNVHNHCNWLTDSGKVYFTLGKDKPCTPIDTGTRSNNTLSLSTHPFPIKTAYAHQPQKANVKMNEISLSI
jgi:hypothetical protein